MGHQTSVFVPLSSIASLSEFSFSACFSQLFVYLIGLVKTGGRAQPGPDLDNAEKLTCVNSWHKPARHEEWLITFPGLPLLPALD